MRKVRVFKWERQTNPATGVGPLVKVPNGEGTFHQWGSTFEEFENGAQSVTAAIIERADGTIETPPADMIQFINPTPENEPK